MSVNTSFGMRKKTCEKYAAAIIFQTPCTLPESQGKKVSFSPSHLQAPVSPTSFQSRTLETEIMVGSTRGLLTHKLTTENDHFTPVSKTNSRMMSFPNRQEDNLKFNIIASSSLSSQRTNASSRLRKFKAFNETLTKKYYSHRYSVFIVLLCGLFLGIIINQALLKSSMGDYISSLKARKDVLTTARVRSLKTMDTHRNLRYLWMFATGMQKEEEISTTNGKIPGTTNRLETFINALIVANRNLRDRFDLLDSDLGKLAFQKDVRMFETGYSDTAQIYVNTSTFDAVDQIIASSLGVIQEARNGNLNSKAEVIGIMIRNILNDILMQTGNMANLFLISLDNYRDSNLYSIITSCIVTVVLLVALLSVFGQGIYQQYTCEKINMTAIAGFSLKDIANMQAQLANFSKKIEDEVSFEDAPLLDVSDFYYQTTSQEKSFRKKKTKGFKSALNMIGIKGKYMVFIIKLTILFACAIGLIVSYTALTQKWTKNLNTKTHQLQLTNTLNEKLTLAASIVLDMVTENDVALVLNTNISVMFPTNLQEISTDKNLVLDFYKTSPESESQILKPLLFEDQCTKITAEMQPFCVNMTSGQDMIGFIQMTTGMESSLTDFKSRFDASNKTNDALKPFRLEVQNLISPNIATLQQLGNLVSTAVDGNLESEIQYGLNQNKIVTGIVCGLLAVLCWLVYYLVLLKVRESDNQFRKMLQVFPANMILSNFILKTYVLKTACGTLNFIKGEL